MKKIILIILIIMLIYFIVPTYKGNATSEVGMPEERLGADFSSAYYAYRLTDLVYESPNTIEAWVRLGHVALEHPGGVIFSNYIRCFCLGRFFYFL